MTLPNEFRWGEHLGCPTLYYRHHKLADYQGGGSRWLVCIGLHRMAYALKQLQPGSRELAIRYVESWACHWDAELREEIGVVIPLPAAKNEPELVHYEPSERVVAAPR